MGEGSNSEGRWGVLLLAHGAPDKLDDIDEFLLNIRGGRPLPPPVVEEIRGRYALIGGGSPLLSWTEKQAKALAKQTKLPVYFAMRNWKPFTADVVPEIVEEGIDRLVVICLAPQNSQTSVGLYRKRLEEALEASGAQIKVELRKSRSSLSRTGTTNPSSSKP
jgi:ferrochelatase